MSPLRRRIRRCRFERGRALLVTVAAQTDPAWLSTALKRGGEELQNLLVNPERCAYLTSNVSRLDGPTATCGRVQRELERLVSEAQRGDTVVFYFAGHAEHRLHTGVEALALGLHDGGVLPLEVLRANLDALAEKLGNGKLVILLDCCAAGALALPAEPLPGAGDWPPAAVETTFEVLARGAGRVVLAAVSSDQRAMVPSGSASSLMTGFLLQGLRGKAGGATRGRLGSCVLEALSWVRRLTGWSRKLALFGRLLATLPAAFERALQDRGWGAVRVFETFEFVSHKVEKEATRHGLAVQTVVLKGEVHRNFALALRPPSLWLCVLVLAVLLAALGMLHCPGAELELRNPRIAALGATVQVVVRGTPCAAGELRLLARRATGDGWYPVASRRIASAGVYAFAFEPSASALLGGEHYQLRALFSRRALPPGPISLPSSAGRWRRLLIRLGRAAGIDLEAPASISPLAELRLGAVEILRVEGRDRSAAGPSPTVPGVVRVEGVARYLDGRQVALWTRTPGLGAAEVRGMALIDGGRWQFPDLALRSAHSWHPQGVAFEARVDVPGVEPFVSEAWHLQLAPPRAWIVGVAGWKPGQGECRLRPWSSIEVRGRAEHTLAGETACVAILGEVETTQTGLWCRLAEIGLDGRWKTRIDIADGQRYRLFTTVCARCPDLRGLAEMGTAQLCQASEID